MPDEYSSQVSRTGAKAIEKPTPTTTSPVSIFDYSSLRKEDFEAGCSSCTSTPASTCNSPQVTKKPIHRDSFSARFFVEFEEFIALAAFDSLKKIAELVAVNMKNYPRFQVLLQTLTFVISVYCRLFMFGCTIFTAAAMEAIDFLQMKRAQKKENSPLLNGCLLASRAFLYIPMLYQFLILPKEKFASNPFSWYCKIAIMVFQWGIFLTAQDAAIEAYHFFSPKREEKNRIPSQLMKIKNK